MLGELVVLEESLELLEGDLRLKRNEFVVESSVRLSLLGLVPKLRMLAAQSLWRLPS